MLEEILATNGLSLETMAICAAAAILCFGFGWLVKGAGGKRREEEHKRNLLEAKRSIPQLESVIRKRESDVVRLEMEVKELNDRCVELTAAADLKDRELRASVRDAKNLRSELNAVKGITADSNNNVIMDGFDDERAEDAEDSRLQQQLKTTQDLYENLRQGLIQRDERIEELESQLDSDADEEANDKKVSQPPMGEADVTSATQAQAEEIATLKASAERLQTQLQECQEERDMLADMAKRRSDNNHVLKEASAEAEAQLPRLEQDIEQRDQTIAAREASIKRLLNDLEETKNGKEHSEAEVAKLSSNLSERDAEVADFQGKFTTLQFTLAQRDERITILSQDIDNQRREISESEAAIEAHADTDGREAELANQLAEHEQQRARLLREAEDLQATVEQKEKWIGKLKSSLGDRESQSRLLESRALAAEKALAAEQALEAERALETQRAVQQTPAEQPQNPSDDTTLEKDRTLAAAVAEAARANAQLKELEQSLSIYKNVIADNGLGINLSEAPMPDQDVTKVVSLRRRPRPVRTQAPRRSKRTTATTLAFRPRRQFKKRR